MAEEVQVVGTHEGGLELRYTFDDVTNLVSSFTYVNPTTRRAQADLYDPETGELLDSWPLPANMREPFTAYIPQRLRPSRFSASISFGFAGVSSAQKKDAE